MDWRAMGAGLLRPFLFWTAAVILLSLGGIPGVVCVTPVAWFMALDVGSQTVARSHTQDPMRRTLEAALAGAVLGLWMGILFFAVNRIAIPVEAEETTRAILISGVVGVAGVLGCAALAAVMARVRMNRMEKDRQGGAK